MAQPNWMKHMKNMELSKTKPDEFKPKRSRFSFQLEIDFGMKKRFMACANDELNYYNKIVEDFSARLRRDHNSLLNIKDEYLGAMLTFAETPIDVFELKRNSITTRDMKLPKNYEPYQHILLGLDRSGNPRLTENWFGLYELVSKNANVSPVTRRKMVEALVSWFKDQALKIKDGTGRIQEVLTTLDSIQKRHLQIFRNDVRIYEHEGIYYVQTRYGTFDVPQNPDEYPNWKRIIIRQEPNVIPTSTTPWIAEFVQNDWYDVKLLDRHRVHGQAFQIGKSRSF